MKKILLVAYFFPPFRPTESIMTFNFVKYLHEFNWSAIVLCAKKTIGDPVGDQISREILENISVHRIRSIGNVLFYIFKKLMILSETFNRIGWVPFAITEGRNILKNKDINVIISRSTSVSSHLVALKLKKLYGLPWVACFSDPWTQNPYCPAPNIVIRKIDEYLERKVMLSADKIVVTTEQTKTLFLKKYNIKEKIEVVPNSFDPQDYQKKGGDTKEGKFVITHAGSFYGLRSPNPFLKALRLLDDEMGISGKIQVNLIGSGSKVEDLVLKYNLSNVVRVSGVISREDVFNYFKNSDVLLLIEAPSVGESVFLPSKLVEYINMSKPILAIVPAGASAEVVRETKTGLVVPLENIEGIKDAIKSYYKLYKSSKLQINPNWEEIKKYDARVCAKKLINIIEGILQSKV